MAVHGMFQIYSSDGSTSLYYNCEASPGDSYIVNETGLMDRADAQVYTYTGNKKFIGFTTTANATEPEYAIGDSTPSIAAADLLTLYIVEEGIIDVPRIIYNGEVIAELSDKEITITCAGKKMLSDIVIVNPAVEEESEPEIGTFRFEEMLLSTSKGETIVFNFNFEVGMTWAEFVNSEYNTPTSVYPSNLKDVVVFINDNDEVQIRYTEPDVTPYDYTTETYVQTIGTQTCNKDDVIKNGYNYVHSSGESGGAN